MNTITQIDHWRDTHHMSWLVILRVVLGAFITYKGAHFAANISQLQAMSLDVALVSAGIAHYVLFAHLLGGPLILLGYYTRAVSLIQIPVLIGAIVFVNYKTGFLAVGNYLELEVSIIVLALLILFSVLGGGKYSVDEKKP